MDALPTAPTAGYVSIAEAARTLGIKPWDVVRLIEDRRIDSVELVCLDSLKRHQARAVSA